MDAKMRDARCLCGAVHFRTVGEPVWSGWCHCTMCQRASGAPAVAWVTFPVERVTWLGEPRAMFRSSAKAERGFCGKCGGALSFQYVAKPDHIDLATAAFDDRESLPPAEHVWADTRLSWMDAGAGLPVRPPKPPGEG